MSWSFFCESVLTPHVPASVTVVVFLATPESEKEGTVPPGPPTLQRPVVELMLIVFNPPPPFFFLIFPKPVPPFGGGGGGGQPSPEPLPAVASLQRLTLFFLGLARVSPVPCRAGVEQ